MSARVSPVVELSQKRLPAGSSTTCQGFWRIAGAAYDMQAKAASAPKLGGPTVLKISLKMRLCDLATRSSRPGQLGERSLSPASVVSRSIGLFRDERQQNPRWST